MKNISKCVLLLSVLVLLSIPFESYGQEVSTFEKQYPCDLLKLDSLIGMVSLSLGSEKAVKKAMPCLLNLWREQRNRGSAAFYVSNAFLSMMETNPRVFFSIMVNEPKIFSEWMDGLPDLSFTWADAPPCGIEEKREQLVLLLKHLKTSGQVLTLKNTVLKRLSTIHCRQID